MTRLLPLTDTASGCRCGSHPTEPTGPSSEDPRMNTQAFPVVGMTCGHCAGAVTEELRALPGVEDVHVELVAGGVSTVTVTSVDGIDDEAVATALDEAGDYRLAPQ
ncbi:MULTISPECIES: heavy-metal-associated domain-containing protein [Rhodococcus]|jgi:copper chaperone CopZ|uniref:Cation transporter n=1 Tax=Rhodococcus aetherivorans TaxID=191292 RepID=N1MCD9_9NOCA|nr:MULTISPECIES: heavy-metal-associated domain-containing protein [Rhodococcus]ETT24727.1 Heavy metal transport/detoxification protein [Rhodococcus rhodochrous ATCC 21198]NCL76452.1 hypothetical protein [Rhodococcus sp. YH1]ANZ26615.1 hypothetical protein A4U64_19445 [Rhodococcus sp. WB1]MDV6294678.1 cation transporter [Rhodococcus aetherivorans]QRI75846.1 cation transporter [Rhodococcus aetherivorans]